MNGVLKVNGLYHVLLFWKSPKRMCTTGGVRPIHVYSVQSCKCSAAIPFSMNDKFLYASVIITLFLYNHRNIKFISLKH